MHIYIYIYTQYIQYIYNVYICIHNMYMFLFVLSVVVFCEALYLTRGFAREKCDSKINALSDKVIMGADHFGTTELFCSTTMNQNGQRTDVPAE